MSRLVMLTRAFRAGSSEDFICTLILCQLTSGDTSSRVYHQADCLRIYLKSVPDFPENAITPLDLYCKKWPLAGPGEDSGDASLHPQAWTSV